MLKVFLKSIVQIDYQQYPNNFIALRIDMNTYLNLVLQNKLEKKEKLTSFLVEGIQRKLSKMMFLA